MREYLLGVAEHWIRFGADGWRLDVAAEIDDDEFWREFRRRVKAVNPEAYIVAEIWHEDHRWLQGDQFDAYMNYPLASAVLSFCAAGHLDQRGHRPARRVGANIRREDGPTFAGGSSTRSRPTTRRSTPSSSTCSAATTRRGSCRCAAATSRRSGWRRSVQMTVPGAPCIYYGDEIGMAGEQDPYCRRAFPWRGPAWDRDLLAFVAAVIALRHANAVLRRGAFRILGAEAWRPPTGALGCRRDVRDLPQRRRGAGAARAGARPGSTARPSSPVTRAGGWPPGRPVAVADGRAEIEIPARAGRVAAAGGVTRPDG